MILMSLASIYVVGIIVSTFYCYKIFSTLNLETPFIISFILAFGWPVILVLRSYYWLLDIINAKKYFKKGFTNPV